jgi:DNA end-binding protein Ku
MPPHSLGSGTISFGLVSIPVRMYTAASSANVSFNQLHGVCGSRIRQQTFCPRCNRTVERAELVRGYEFAKDQYVQVKDEELKGLEGEASKIIDITEFVPLAEVDPIYFEKTYYLGPDKGGERAYKLLAEAMLSTGLVGIASYSARGKQYIISLRPFQEGLIMHQLRYAQEVKPWSEVPLPDLPEIKPAELGLAKQIIQQIAHETFAPEKYKDEVQARMLDLIQKKVEGQEITVAPEAPVGKVIDLMEALKASLGMSAATDDRKPAKAAEPAKEEPKKKTASKKK